MREIIAGQNENIQKEVSVFIGAGGASQSVSISATSAQSAVIDADNATVYSTVDCFVRAGANPTALANGTDQFIPGGSLFRIRFASGQKLAFIAAEAGNVYITPGA
jgi:hypothetical protein